MDLIERIADKALHDKARKSVRAIQRCIELFEIEHVSLSFNGGKDSTALLHLLRMATDDEARRSKPGTPQSFQCFYLVNEDDFEEVEAFVRQTDDDYDLNVRFIDSKDFKASLQGLVDYNGIKAIILGTRRGDPNVANQDIFCPSSEGWPAFMRCNPIMDWSYADVWAFLRACNLPYCNLYDQGYTSLGAKHNTLKNQALLQEDGSYAPAYMLPDGRLERAGRASSVKPPPVPAPASAPAPSPAPSTSSTVAGPSSLSNHHIRMSSEIEGHRASVAAAGGSFSHTAAVLVIGDEILSGKVEDCNLSYLASELREIGWVLIRAAFVPDDPDAIASELSRLSSAEIVLSCGGIG